MRLSTYICAAIAPIIALVITLSGCSYAQDSRGITVTSRVNKEKGSEEVRNERQTFQNVTSQMDSPYERNSTGSNLTSRGVLPIRKGAQTRLVGGKTAKIEEFPFVASLEKKRRHYCSLFIINEWWLLTAGHCTINIHFEDNDIVEFAKPREFSVVAGSPLLTINITKTCVKDEVRRKVDRLLWHPRYVPPLLVSDLVLVHVSRRLPFSSRIKPATLPNRSLNSQQHLITGRQCQLIGWGPSPVAISSPRSKTRDEAMSLIKETCRKEINVELLLVLQAVTLTVLSSRVCIKEYPYVDGLVIEKEHICIDEEQDPYGGDSGSPLICDGTLVALMSGGFVRGNVSIPTAFTRIDSHLEWISTTTALGKANLPSLPTNVVVVVTLSQLAIAVASICHG